MNIKQNWKIYLALLAMILLLIIPFLFSSWNGWALHFKISAILLWIFMILTLLIECLVPTKYKEKLHDFISEFLGELARHF